MPGWPHFGWKRALVFTHRWLGIAGCLLFVTWFASGIVMIYARMPVLTTEARLARLPPLAIAAVAVSPAEAASRLGREPRAVRLGMLDDRPVYRFATAAGPVAVFADTGDLLPVLGAAQALAVARTFIVAPATPQVAARLDGPDQWTLSASRGLFPLYRVALADPAGTELYISATTGEPMLETTASGRRWGYFGAVVHWLYFTPLRRHGALWSNVIIWLSLAGCVMCLSGLVWGVWSYSPASRYRLKRQRSHTPYTGLMRWHHYAGLVFGVTTFTWIFSGLLSMDPWDWHPGNSPTAAQRLAVTGGPLGLASVSVPRLRAAARTLAETGGAREVELIQFRGSHYLLGYQAPDPHLLSPTPAAPLRQQLVALDGPERGPFPRFDDDAVMASALDAMPRHPPYQVSWLQSYDGYYYDRDGGLPLPVLRVRFTDPVDTWLYLDPRRGAIVLKEERWSRVNRWLYHGLHSLDFPVLYARRPLWDAVVIVLSLGGLASAITAISPAWRRLRRLALSREVLRKRKSRRRFRETTR